MPILTTGNLKIDYTDDGVGELVILVHSAVSANRQWRALTEALKDRYRVLAINLFGYGDTTPWFNTSEQSLDDQAQLVVALAEETDGPVHLVGHSLGGSVALKVAMTMGQSVESLIMFEPNPFHLLQQGGRVQAYQEALSLQEYVKTYGSQGDWPKVAELFANYWLGDDSWRDMPEKRRAAFAASLPPNYFEWDAILGEQTTIEDCKAITARTLVISDKATRRTVREIVELLVAACPHWSFHYIEEGGHMAPLTCPDVVNPIIRAFLDAGAA